MLKPDVRILPSICCFAITELGDKFTPGANPTIVSYSASVVKINNNTSSLVRFFEKKSSTLKKTV
jgi:hypothetical protein